MTEYINKAQLKKELHERATDTTVGTMEACAYINAITIADIIPETIDIVRCSECEYWQCGKMDLGLDCHTYPDHFCAEGERKK